MEINVFRTPITTSHIYPCSIAAEKRPYFATKPAVGGNPARDIMKTVIAAESQGLCAANPR